MIRVLIADDHIVIRNGLEKLLSTADDIEVIGSVADGASAVETTRTQQPDVVLMDLSMPIMDGIEATRQISASFPLDACRGSDLVLGQTEDPRGTAHRRDRISAQARRRR